MVVDADGTEHVRFQRVWGNVLPVIGGDFVVHSRQGRLVNVTQTLDSDVRPVNARAAFGRGYAINAATQQWMGWTIGRQTSKDYGIPRGMPYLTGFVIHTEIVEDSLAA